MGKKIIKAYKDQKPYQIAPAPDVSHLPKVKGYDFEEIFDIQTFLESYSTTGFQATHLGKAIHIAKEMQDKNSMIFLGYTSNMVSSGIREIIRYLVQHKMVHVLVTTAGGVEEDIIKVLKPFHIGAFHVTGRSLFEKGINRTGNIFVPNDRFAHFDKFMQSFFEKIYKQQQETKKILCPKDLTRELGLEIKEFEGDLLGRGSSKVTFWKKSEVFTLSCSKRGKGEL